MSTFRWLFRWKIGAGMPSMLGTQTAFIIPQAILREPLATLLRVDVDKSIIPATDKCFNLFVVISEEEFDLLMIYESVGDYFVSI